MSIISAAKTLCCLNLCRHETILCVYHGRQSMPGLSVLLAACYRPVQVPVILSVVINPPTVSAGQSFTVTVTLAQPVAGTLRFTSAPLGVSCPTVTLSVSDNPITVTCTAPQATTVVQIAGVPGSTEGASQPAAGQAVPVSATATAAQQPPTEDASVQVADDIEAHAAYQPGPQGGGAWPRFVRHQLSNLAATRAYTITAIVTADRSATKAAQLKGSMADISCCVAHT